MTLMVIYFLQQKALLPSIELLQQDESQSFTQYVGRESSNIIIWCTSPFYILSLFFSLDSELCTEIAKRIGNQAG